MVRNANQKRDLEVVVNGTSYGVFQFPEGISLEGLRAKALAETKNVGQPPEEWDLKDSDGNLLDLRKHLRDYGGLLQVWLGLKAGEGGQAQWQLWSTPE